MNRKAPCVSLLLWFAVLAMLVVVTGCSKKSVTTTGEDGKGEDTAKVSRGDKLPSGMPANLSFTADLVDVKGAVRSTGKTYVKGDKSRTEITGGDKKSVTIVRGDKKLAWYIDPEKKMYMEMPMGDQQAMIGPEAEKMLEELGERKLVGEETVNGHPCDKYEFVYHDKNMGKQTHWMSKKLGVMVKLEHHNPNYPMSMELRNISEKNVSDSLFELPSGYTKMEIPGMPGR